MSPTTLTGISTVTLLVSSTLRATLRVSPTWRLSLTVRVISGHWSGGDLGSWWPPGKS